MKFSGIRVSLNLGDGWYALTSSFVQNSMVWMRHSMHSTMTWIPLVWNDYCSRRVAHRFRFEWWLDLLSMNAMVSHWNTVIHLIRILYVEMVRYADQMLSHKQSTDNTSRRRHIVACETFLCIRNRVQVERQWKMNICNETRPFVWLFSVIIYGCANLMIFSAVWWKCRGHTNSNIFIKKQ